VRPRKLLLFALVVLGAVAAVPPALATASEAMLEVNNNCNGFTNWPCWTRPGGSPVYTPSVTIASGGDVAFSDETGHEANIKWTSTPSGPPTCSSKVPVSPTPPETGWKGECKFPQPGIYRFESSTLFKESGYTPVDYTKYEIVVAGTPTDATTSASGETQTEAMLNGSIDPEGNSVEYHFEYEGPGVTGKQPTPTATLSTADFTSHPVSAQVTGLEPGMTYHFQLVATYGAGKTSVSGATQQTFTTHTVTAPAATTLAAEGFKETEATLKGTVNLGGEATEYFFEYGTDTHYSQKTEKATLQTSGGSNQGVSAALKGLTPGTEYHVRLVAENKHGSEKGVDRSFKTMSPATKEPTIEPHAKEPTPSPTPTPTPGPISPKPEIAPLVRPLVEGSLKLTAPRHGSSVRGSLEIASSGVGGRLEIDLIANSASLAKVRHQKSTSTVVGRLVRSSLYAGKVSFSISLNAKAKRALSRHHKLALSVQIVLTPVHSAAVTITRSVVLHA
jgi:hypothetical protein